MSGRAWFRVWSEVVDDEKLRLLAFEDRWHFMAILACKAQGILDTGDNEQMLRRKVAVKLGLQVRELEEVARRLAEVGLICKATLQPLAWNKRQFSSDSDPTAAERQRRRREKNKKNNAVESVTDTSRVTSRTRHGDVTLPETESESDTDSSSLRSEEPHDSSHGVSGKGPTPRPKRVSATEVDQVLDYLNARAGTAYKRVNGDGREGKNADLVRARIREHGVAALLVVIDRKCQEWMRNDKMRPYLRPATLFGAQKCEQYVGEARRDAPGSFLDDDNRDVLTTTWRAEP